MKNTFALSILRPLTRLLRICALILTGILSGEASAESATNDILTISYIADVGLYGVQTGSNNPNPGETVTYGGASYFTVRDYTRGIDYTNNARPDPDTTTGKLSQLMGKGTVVALSDRGFRSTWALPNFTVIQEVEILGSTLADTSVREQVSVQNTGSAPLSYGIRYLWNWRVAHAVSLVSPMAVKRSAIASVITMRDITPSLRTY